MFRATNMKLLKVGNSTSTSQQRKEIMLHFTYFRIKYSSSAYTLKCKKLYFDHKFKYLQAIVLHTCIYSTPMFVFFSDSEMKFSLVTTGMSKIFKDLFKCGPSQRQSAFNHVATSNSGSVNAMIFLSKRQGLSTHVQASFEAGVHERIYLYYENKILDSIRNFHTNFSGSNQAFMFVDFLHKYLSFIMPINRKKKAT